MKIRCEGVTQRFRGVVALDDLTTEFEEGVIHGLLGRNGSGKSTLLALVAALRRPTSGALLVDGRDPWERAEVVERICLIREDGDVGDDESVRDALDIAESLRPSFDRPWAERLLADFSLDAGRKVGRLSRGQRSAVGVVLGLASRAPLTIFDETHLGMDAPSRRHFYDEVLTDYATHPRTIVFATHLIDEISPLLEQVTVLDRGRVVAAGARDDLLAGMATVVGPAEAVERVTAGRPTTSDRRLGGTLARTVGAVDDDWRRSVRAGGLDLEPVSLQDLVIHLTEPQEASA